MTTATRSRIEGGPTALSGGRLLLAHLGCSFVRVEGHRQFTSVRLKIQFVKAALFEPTELASLCSDVFHLPSRGAGLLLVSSAPWFCRFLRQLSVLRWAHVSQRRCEILTLMHPANDAPVALGRGRRGEFERTSIRGVNGIQFTVFLARPLVELASSRPCLGHTNVARAPLRSFA